MPKAEEELQDALAAAAAARKRMAELRQEREFLTNDDAGGEEDYVGNDDAKRKGSVEVSVCARASVRAAARIRLTRCFASRLRLVHDDALATADGSLLHGLYVITGGLVFLELSLPLVESGLLDGLSERSPRTAGQVLAKIGI